VFATLLLRSSISLNIRWATREVASSLQKDFKPFLSHLETDYLNLRAAKEEASKGAVEEAKAERLTRTSS